MIRFRLLEHECGARTWIVTDQAPVCERCQLDTPWLERISFFAEDAGPGFPPTQVTPDHGVDSHESAALVLRESRRSPG